jgi:hypothetical protein
MTSWFLLSNWTKDSPLLRKPRTLSHSLLHLQRQLVRSLLCAAGQVLLLPTSLPAPFPPSHTHTHTILFPQALFLSEKFFLFQPSTQTPLRYF